jgi:hypothetical protein|tara:strand:- start:733 stop:852 length:120 start_codon:yes stop_codon:yes gene_type:complete
MRVKGDIWIKAAVVPGLAENSANSIELGSSTCSRLRASE